ncbi:MAG: PQQ-binding-like beta-propeller repeat protein [Bryobacteraceae bacterium]
MASGGPKLLWSIKGLGSGYGSLPIKADRIYVQGTNGDNSVVFALNRADGKPVWNAAIGRALDQDRGGGPRGTPAVEGDYLYALTENGDLGCVRLKDASVTWKKNIQDFGGKNPYWLISESPLLEGNKVIVSPGGNGAGIVALDKLNGNTLWSSKDLNDRAGYASCIAANVGRRPNHLESHSVRGCRRSRK